MHATPVSDGIHWVGAIGWNLRDFHGFETPNGTTYNAPIDPMNDVINHVEPDPNGKTAHRGFR